MISSNMQILTQQLNFIKNNKLMNFDMQLKELILKNSPEVANLRARAINGNNNSLESFCYTIQHLLQDQKLHHFAYRQINQLLMTARPEIANRLNNSTLLILANVHRRQDLDNYIVFWEKIMPGSQQRIAYPNLKNTFKKIKPNLSNIVLSKQFNEMLKQFQKNIEAVDQQKVQFFEDSSFTSQAPNEVNHIDILQLDLQQIKEIRNLLSKQENKDQYNRQFEMKAHNFLTHKSQNVKKQMLAEVIENQNWCKQYLQKNCKKDKKVSAPFNTKKQLNKQVFYQPEVVSYGGNDSPHEDEVEVVESDGQEQKMQKNKDKSHLKVSNGQKQKQQKIRKQLHKQIFYSKPDQMGVSGNHSDQVQVVDSEGEGEKIDKSKNRSNVKAQWNPQSKTKLSNKIGLPSQNIIKNESLGVIHINQNQKQEQIFQEQRIKAHNSKRMLSVDENRLKNIADLSKNSDQKVKANRNTEFNAYKNDHPNQKVNLNRYTQDYVRDKTRNQRSGHLYTLAPNYTQEHQSYTIQNSSGMKASNIKQPNFILDASQFNNRRPSPMKASNLSNFSKTRPKIFGNNNSRISKQSKQSPHYSSQPNQQDLKIYKHGGNKNYQQNNEFFNNFILSNVKPNMDPQQHQNKPKSLQNIEHPNQNLMTPLNYKNLNNGASPSTVFLYKTGFGSTTKKLSEFNQEKKKRKMELENQEISSIEPYLYAPYYQYFNDNLSFSKFRRNCLENSLTLFTSSVLMIVCNIFRDSESKLRVEVQYFNKCNKDLLIETLYKIPKCLKIQKQSQIKKRFILSNDLTHRFTVQLLEFPLQACVMYTKYTFEVNNHQQIKTVKPLSILLPITMRNFLNYFVISENEWVDSWSKWSEFGHFRRVKNIFLEGFVLHQEELETTLGDFCALKPIEGYSVKQFATFCIQPKYNNLGFLLRISQRVSSIITMQLLANKKQVNANEIDYLEYCLNFWSMLLAKL